MIPQKDYINKRTYYSLATASYQKLGLPKILKENISFRINRFNWYGSLSFSNLFIQNIVFENLPHSIGHVNDSIYRSLSSKKK